MGITDLPILSMLRNRMEWHQERQQLLSQNVANADTPGFRAKDLRQPDFSKELTGGALALTRSNKAHLASAGGDPTFDLDRNSKYDISPVGNGVSLEDEMMKVAQNQMDFQAATALYSRSLGLIKTAFGK